MADNIKELKFKVSGDTTELVSSWEKAKTSLNDLSAVLSAKAKAINGLSEIQQRNFDKLQELAKAEQELIRRTGLATLELGKIQEKVSKQVENGVLSEAEAYKKLQKDASTYYNFVEAQERKVRALSPVTVGATSTAGGSERSPSTKSDPNVYFDFAKNRVVNLKEKLAEEENAIKASNQAKLESIKAYEDHVIKQEKESLDKRKKLLDEANFQNESNLNNRKVQYQNSWNELLKGEEEIQKKRDSFVKDFQERQVQRNKELLDRQKFDEEASLNARRVAQANLFSEILDKEEAQKRASILATQTKKQQELAATKIQEENLRKQFTSFQRNLSQEEAALKHSLQVQLQEHLTGIHSIEVARLNSIEKIRQLEERRSRLININSSRVQAGIITPEAGTTRQSTINAAFVPAIHAANIGLAEQNARIKEISEGHRTLHSIVRNIIATYATWVSLQNTVVLGFQKFLEVGINLESVKSSLSATAGSVAAMDNLLISLDAESSRTGIQISALRDNFKNLHASMTLAGEEGSTIYKVFTNLNSVITSLHLNADQSQHVFLAIAQIFNKGKVQSEELVKQLGNLLPGAFSAFAQATGRSTQQLSKDMKAGLVFAHDTIEDFTSFLVQKFGASFAIASKGMNSELGRLSSSFTHLGEAIYNQTNGPIISFVRTLTSVTDNVTSVVNGTSPLTSTIKLLGETLLAASVILTGKFIKSLIVSKFELSAMGKEAITTSLLLNKLGAGLVAFGKANIGTAAFIGLAELALHLRNTYDNYKQVQDAISETTKLLNTQTESVEKLTKAQQLQFKVENAEEVIKVQKEVNNAKKALSEYELSILTTQEGRVALIKKIQEGEKNLTEVQKRTREALFNQQKDEEELLVTQKQDTIESLRKLELETIDTVAAKREKLQLQFQEQNKKLYSDLKQRIEAGKDKTSPVTGEVRHPKDEQIKDAQIANEQLTKLEDIKNKTIEQQLQVSTDKQLKTEDSVASKIIQLQKKKFDALEKQSKAFYEQEIERISNLQNFLELKQNLPSTAIGTSTFINQSLDLERQKHEQIIEQIKSQQVLNSLKKEENDTTAATLKSSSKEIQNLIDIINKLETGHIVEPSRKRAISPTAALGLQQVQPSTLTDYGVNVPQDILDLESRGKRTGRLPGGRYKKLDQIFSADEQKRLRDYAESIESTLQQVQIAIVEGDYAHFKGDAKLTLAAYNAGRGGATQATLPAETIRYLENSKLSESTKTERFNIAQQYESKSVEEQQNLELLKEENRYALEKAKLEQSSLIVNKQVGNEILQQLITQKQSSGELVEAARLQDILDNGDKRLLLSKEEQDSVLSDQNKRLLELTNAARDRNIEEAKLTEILNKQSIAYTNLQFELDKINNSVQTGNETPFGAIVESQTKAAEAARIREANMPSIIAGINKLRDQGTITPLQANQQIIDEQRGLLELQTQAQGVENYFRTNLASAFEAPFKNIIEGKTNAIGALKEFGVAILSLLEELIVKELALAAAKAAVSAVSSSIGFFSQGGSVSEHSGVSYGLFSQSLATGGQVLNFPSGGVVKGPGTETSDSIKALVAPGSYVIKASSVPAFDKAAATLINVSKNEKILPPNVVQMFGKDRLDKINTNGSYAEGGLVGKEVLPSNLGLASSSAMSYTNNYHISVNVPEGKQSKEEARQTGNEIAVAMMQKIARIETSKQISIYDKTHKLRKG